MSVLAVRKNCSSAVLHWLSLAVVSLALLLNTTGPIEATILHPVSVTRAQVFVTPSQVQATIEVYFEDLYLFHQLTPNEADFLSADTLREGIELHRRFLAQKFRLQLDDGRYLTPDQLPEVDVTIPKDGVALGALMTHQLTYRLNYSLAAPAEHLTVVQEFTDETGVLLSEMQLHVMQEGHEPLAPKVLSAGMPAIYRFDWENPPLSTEASAEERAAFEKRVQSELLGITSYSNVYSFLYIEPKEIRHEILIPLMSLEQMVPIPRADRNSLRIEEQDQVKPAIADFFSTGNPIIVDGVNVQLQVDRVDFFGLSFKDFAVLGERRDVPASSARVGVILRYPLPKPPQHVQLTWDLFHKSLLAVRTVLIAPDRVSQHSLTRVGGRNRIDWQGSLEPLQPLVEPIPAQVNEIPKTDIPVLAVFSLVAGLFLGSRRKGKWLTRIPIVVMCVLIAIISWNKPSLQISVRSGKRPPPAPGYSSTVVNALLNGVYQSFEGQDESSIYDSLTHVTTGEVRQRVYLEILNELRMSEQGGAVARVTDIEIKSVGPPQSFNGDDHTSPRTESDSAWSTQVTWTVAGTVEHWGHVHERVNQFTADMVIDTSDTQPSHWQISRLDVTAGERVSFRTKVR